MIVAHRILQHHVGEFRLAILGKSPQAGGGFQKANGAGVCGGVWYSLIDTKIRMWGIGVVVCGYFVVGCRCDCC